MQDLDDKVTGDSLPADQWDQVPSELQNAITSTGIALSAGDLNQLAKTIAIYSLGAQFCNDSGTVNTLVLGTPNSLKTAPTLFKGLKVRTKVAVTNTGATTLNYASTGAKKVLLDGTLVELSANMLVATYEYEFLYDPALDGGNGAYTTKLALTGIGTTTPAATVSTVGMFGDFAGTTAPTGWLICNGLAVSRTTYAALFAYIGTTWGSGNGTTTFNLPNAYGRFRRGLNTTGSGLDNGRLPGSLQSAQNVSHTHFVCNTDSVLEGTAVTSSNQVTRTAEFSGPDNDYTLTGTATAATAGKTSSSGSSDGRPDNYAGLVCIAYI